MLHMEHEWAMIRTLFAGRRLIDPEKVNADTKGNKPMDEENIKGDTSWRFYEAEKRLEELEKMLIAHRRFTLFSLASLHVICLTMALWMVSLHGW